jgi:hypothetical protein
VVVERVESETFRLVCPELTNPLERRQASKALEHFREVIASRNTPDARAGACGSRSESA